jgi:hypothetical protein
MRRASGAAAAGASVMLSVQNLLDCGWAGGMDAGSCNGGSWELAFEFARSTGICDDRWVVDNMWLSPLIA